MHGRDLKGDELAKLIEEFCNGGATKTEVTAFVDQLTKRTHRTLQQKVAGLMVATFEAWAVSPCDARNEATVKLAKKFVEATGDKYDRYLPTI